jgi:hypothetical protein
MPEIIEIFPQPETRDWKKDAEKAGFTIPKPFPGIKIIDFLDYPVKELIENVDKLQFDPRMSGTDSKHVDSIARSIEFGGYEGPPMYAIKDARTGKVVPLRHHILKAVNQLDDWEFIPTFIVKAEPYQDKKGRMRQPEEILKDFTGDGPGGLNDHPPARNMEMDDRIRTVDDKSRFGEFGQVANPKSYKKQVKAFVHSRWAHKVDKKTLGKIIEGHLKGVMPKKVERFEKSDLTTRFPEVPKSSKWDYENNILEAVCHSTAIKSTYGSWLTALMKGYDEAINIMGKPEEEVRKKLSEVRIQLWSYVNIGTGKNADGISAARIKTLSEVRAFNLSPVFPYPIHEINFAPQILEPKEKKETAWDTYIWNKKTKSF